MAEVNSRIEHLCSFPLILWKG